MVMIILWKIIICSTKIFLHAAIRDFKSSFMSRITNKKICIVYELTTKRLS